MDLIVEDIYISTPLHKSLEGSSTPKNKLDYNNLKNIPITPSAKNAMDELKEKGHNPLIVGGAVRDSLLGKSPKDVDVEVYNTDFDNLHNILQKHGKVDAVGKAFGVLKFKDKEGGDYDFSVPRRDNKSGVGHKDFNVEFDKNMTPEEGAKRRDFTFNSLAYSPHENKLHDPYGGAKDLENGIIKHTSDQFEEDPLRVLRAMQFQSRYGFEVHPETKSLMKKMVDRGDLEHLPKERVSEEFGKWAEKGTHHHKIFDFMKDTGMYKHFPDLEKLQHTDQDEIYHPEGNVETHTKHVLNSANEIAERDQLKGEDKQALIFASLLHDIAKPPTTQTEMKNGRQTITSKGHEEAGVPIAENILKKIGIKQDLINRIKPMIANHLQHINIGNISKGSSYNKAVGKLARKMQPSNIEDLSRLMEADHSGRPPLPKGMPEQTTKLLEASKKLKVEKAPTKGIITGRHLMSEGLDPSPKFKEHLNNAVEAQEGGEFNDEESGKQWLKNYLANNQNISKSMDSPTVIEVFADPISKAQLNMFRNETPEVPPVENKPIQVQTKVKSAKNPNVPVINPLNEKEHTIMQNLGQHVPALAGLMQEGIDTHKKLSEIIAKAGGHPDRGEYLFKPKALNHLPFASRLYSQHITSNRATQEKRDESINDFKQRLQEAKEYLNNPESDEELANIKNERETKKKNALESALKKQAEATARVEAEVPEKLARMKTYTDNLDFIKTLMPYANPLDPKRDPRWYGTGSNDAEQIGTMLHNGVSKENITVGKKIHERMEEGGEIKVTPFERFMQGFGNRHNYDVNSLNEDLKKYAADKGDAFHSEKIEGLRNDLSKIAAEHSNKLQKAQLDMFGGEAPEVPKVPANPSEDRMSNLSVDHKQIYNTLTKKQNSNSITSPERTHLQRFNQYLKGDISHEQLKGYIAYKQNEHHTPLFQNAPEVPKVESPVPEPQQVKPETVSKEKEPPNVPKIEAPATDKAQFPSVEPKIDPVEAPKKKFNYEVLKETEKAMHLKIPSWEGTDEYKKSHKQHYHELWIPKSVLAKGDDYAKQFAIQAREKIRTSNPYQKAFGKRPYHWDTMGEYAPPKEKKTRIVPDNDKAQKMLAEMKHRYNGESLERLSIDGGLSDEDYKLFLALRFTTDYDGKFKNDPLHPMKTDTYYESPLKKSQMDMFGGEPKVDDIQVKPSENFIKPEHELTSDSGTWKLKGDPTATAKMHKWIKDKYNKKEIYTYGGLLQSGHPLADKIKELHSDNQEAIFDHYNKITGRESGKPAGVGETQLRMSMKDGGGLPIGDKHFQVPDLSKKAKIERDSYPSGIALHQALNNGDVSPELHKWHKDYKFNSHHTDKGTISTENPEGKKYERTLYDKDADNFGSVKQTNEDNLSPEDLEKYQSLKEKYGQTPEFDYTHHDRLNELKEKANKAYPLSDKFSPEDKEVYNRLQEDKDRFTRALQEKGITAKQKEANQEVLDDLAHQESEMHNDYREKLGLHKNDLTGEKGFSYKQELEPEEKTEFEDLKNRKQFSKLHQQYNQPPEEHHVSKLLKYPMSSNQKTFDDDHMEEPEENANLFDRNQAQPEPEVPEKMDVSEKVNAPKQTKKAKVPQISIEDHFPTVGIRTPGSLQKVGKEYGHRPEDSTKEYKPTSMVDFNGSKYQIQSDGGNYVIAKNLGTGKVDTIAKNDLENYPTDKKVPMVYKQDVEKFMNQQGDKEMPLEDIYSGMKFPDDIKGKEHIKKKIKMALLQLEHNFDPEEGHTPIVNRSIGTPHPKEKDPREKGIMYKLAKSMKEFATQNRIYIKGRNLIKSLMIELYPKEKSIYEKSIESLDILHSLAELKDREESLSGWLDNIQATSIMKSATHLLDLSCKCIDESTDYLSTIQSRFELLKSMDDGSFQKFIDEAVAADEEEEQRTTYRLSKSYKNKQIENGNE